MPRTRKSPRLCQELLYACWGVLSLRSPAPTVPAWPSLPACREPRGEPVVIALGLLTSHVFPDHAHSPRCVHSLLVQTICGILFLQLFLLSFVVSSLFVQTSLSFRQLMLNHCYLLFLTKAPRGKKDCSHWLSSEPGHIRMRLTSGVFQGTARQIQVMMVL